MGLFSNKKKLCPICGEPTPRLFSTKVEGMPICSVCANKIFLPNGAVDQMSLDEFQAYMNYYEENQVLRDKFQPEYEFGVDFGMYIKIDTKNGLFSLSSSDNALVFEKSCIETYRILEENEPLFQGNKTAIKFFNSRIPQLVREMGPVITQFELQKREYEMLERMENFLDKDDDDRNNSRPYRSRPRFDGNEPFGHFSVRVRMEHPYWQGIHTGKYSAPLFDREYPRIDEYLRDYNERVDKLRELANKFKDLVNPNSKIIYDGENVGAVSNAVVASAPQAAANVDVVEEVKRYKGLLDAGIITEEEFVAKKKQLLGI